MKIVKLLSWGFVGISSSGVLEAAIDIDSPTSYYDTSNWYAIRNGGTPSLDSAENKLTVGNFKYDSMFFCYFEPVVLSSGEYFRVSGKLNLSDVHSGSGGNTVVGVFDSGSYPQTVLASILTEKSFGNAYDSKSTNLGASSVTGEMFGFLTSPKLAYNRNAAKVGSTCVATNAGGKKIADHKTAFNDPVAGTDYAFFLEILRNNDNSYSATFSLDGGERVRYDSLQNEKLGNLSVLAFKLPVGTGDSVVLSELYFETTGTVIPEPSFFGLITGLGALAFVGARRRRLA